jgi:uncharacterized protein (DUF362 family)
MLVVTYGEEMAQNAYETLKAGDILKTLRPEYSVAIKPNLVVARPASEGATTHPEIVEGIILFLKETGVKNIKIIESSWVGEGTKRAFKACGYEELAKRHGIPLVDLKADSFTAKTCGKYKINICDEALGTDFLINVPVLKAHCQTRFTCCLKNLKGCVPDSEKRRFHSLGIHGPVAALGMLLKTGYNLVDGVCGDLSFEEGGTPVEANRIIAGKDPLLVDTYCAELIGYKPEDIEYLALAKGLGVGGFYSAATKLVELNAQEKPVRKPRASRKTERYLANVEEDAACSACYSSLMYAMHRLGGRAQAGKIHIGQGFKGKTGDGVGIGRCAAGVAKYVHGCPPKATDIIELLKH